ncbi:hypothetical protein BKA64DRAFT_225817 [Cadophora sp. MPI-SDFR-AT-0126]|nr:hypothetical protein BKA64DRAFT_225817 [Leotiomycetes sp. MPI-SDFR-AT-0126]
MPFVCMCACTVLHCIVVRAYLSIIHHSGLASTASCQCQFQLKLRLNSIPSDTIPSYPCYHTYCEESCITSHLASRSSSSSP